MLIALTLLVASVAAAQPAATRSSDRPKAGKKQSSAAPLMVPYQQDGKWGYKTPKGKVVLKPRFVLAQPFTPEGIAAVVDQHGWAYIDQSAKVIIRPMVVDNAPDDFKDGVARFPSDGKVGFFDEHGVVAIQPKYAFAESFSEGRAAVCEGCHEVVEKEHHSIEGGKWGFIDRTGALVIPIQFEEVESFKSGKARVKLDGEWKYIDLKGAAVAEASAEAR